jgi:hypothetical protein
MDYNDPMPPGLVFLLNKEIYIDPTDWNQDNSYGNGGRHLLKLIDYRNGEHRRLEESRRNMGQRYSLSIHLVAPRAFRRPRPAAV